MRLFGVAGGKVHRHGGYWLGRGSILGLVLVLFGQSDLLRDGFVAGTRGQFGLTRRVRVLDRLIGRGYFLRLRRHRVDRLRLGRFGLGHDFRAGARIDVGAGLVHAGVPPQGQRPPRLPVPSSGNPAPDLADAPVDEEQADKDHDHADDLDGQDGFAQDGDAEDQRRNRRDEGRGGKVGGADARQDAVHDLEGEGGREQADGQGCAPGFGPRHDGHAFSRKGDRDRDDGCPGQGNGGQRGGLDMLEAARDVERDGVAEGGAQAGHHGPEMGTAAGAQGWRYQYRRADEADAHAGHLGARGAFATNPEMGDDGGHHGREGVDDGRDAAGQMRLCQREEREGYGIGDDAQQAQLQPQPGFAGDRLAQGQQHHPAAQRPNTDAKRSHPERPDLADQDGVEDERTAPDGAEQNDPDPITQTHGSDLSEGGGRYACRERRSNRF